MALLLAIHKNKNAMTQGGNILWKYKVDLFSKINKNKVRISRFITKTCLYNFDPLIPHFYIVKLGFTGLYIIFLISAQNID